MSGSVGKLASRRSNGRRVPPPTGPACDADLQQFYLDWFMPLVRRAHWQHHLSPEDARDVVQDAFLLALDKLDSHRNPKAWLKRVVDNLAMNMIRTRRRRSRLLARWSDSGMPPPRNPEEY
jgi:DNA-directed RNA polymerase specialized sigma24 family protein